jgi:predicted RNase H-like HicB family nuclease
MKFAVVIEEGDSNYSAYVPDLPGCVGAADTVNEVKQLMNEAIEFHLEGMLLHGEEVPEPTTRCCYLYCNRLSNCHDISALVSLIRQPRSRG